MILYGSTTSPYARRTRIFTHKLPFTFVNLDVFNQDREQLMAKNPTMKIPFIVDEDETVFDSRIIFRYLTAKFKLLELTWAQENTLTVIDAANDSLVELLILNRSGFDTSEDRMFFKLQRERIDTVLATLNKQCQAGDFSDWHYPSICLYCLLDWLIFRELTSLESYPDLIKFWQNNQQREDVLQTDPRI